MPEFKWNVLKSERLKKTRGVSFEEILAGTIIRSIAHPARPEQKVFLVLYRDYIWAVPYVDEGKVIFLKTLYPSRKYTKWFKEGRFS